MAAKITVQEIMQHSKDIEYVEKHLLPIHKALQENKDEEGYRMLGVMNRLRGFVHRLTDAEVTVKG